MSFLNKKEEDSEQKILTIVGAGPKAIAVAVKAKVLKEFGFSVDRVILIEKNIVGANWSGEYGYTDGEMLLGTPPEKDVVFPFATDVGDDLLNARIKQRLMYFTWSSFLIHTNQYIEWLDRGRLAPSHRFWAQYLQWVAEQLGQEITLIKAEVTLIDITDDDKRWKLTLKTPENKEQILFSNKLMVTGPGKTKLDLIERNTESLPPGTFDLESFWNAIQNKKLLSSGRMAVIGSGEQAASVLLGIVQYCPKLTVDIIASKGFLSIRSESYFQNRIFTDPTKHEWQELSLADRMDFIKHTDLGVFSPYAMNILSKIISHKIVPGHVTKLTHDGQAFILNIVYNKESITREYDQVIFATGFDQTASLQSLLTSKAQEKLAKYLASALTNQAIAQSIGEDLSVTGFRPYLHLPMLASLMQGPGFSNLSCLGLLADRVILSSRLQNTKNQI